MGGEVRNFWRRQESFIEYLMDRMQEASQELRFEDAQYFKEQIEALGKLKKKRFSLKSGGAALHFGNTGAEKSFEHGTLPEKIICFDVSNIQGTEAVASKVAFYRELRTKSSTGVIR